MSSSSPYGRLQDSSSHAAVVAQDADAEDTRRLQKDAEVYERSFTFTWLRGLLALAQERTLQQSDAPPLPKKCLTKTNTHLLKQHWQRNERASLSSPRKHSTFRLALAIWQIWGWEYLGIGTFLATASLIGFAGPLLLHSLVECAEQKKPAATIGSYIVALFCCKIVGALAATRYSFRTSLLAISIGSAIKGCVFEKTMRLSTLSRQNYTAGNISNLYTTDIERVVGLAVVLHNFWSLPLEILVAMVLLWQVVGLAMLSGLISIVLLLMLNNYISILQKRANDLIMTAKDERMKVTAECFGAMLIIKLNAWESKFREKILACRHEELKHVWTMLYISAYNICLLWLAPNIVAVSTILTFALALRGQVSAARVFTALSLFRMLQDPLRSLPGNITQLFQAMSSLQRLQKFYDMADKGDDVAAASSADSSPPSTAAKETATAADVDPLLRGSIIIPTPTRQVWFSDRSSSLPQTTPSNDPLPPAFLRFLIWIRQFKSRSSKPAGSVEMIVSDRNSDGEGKARSNSTVSPLSKRYKPDKGVLEEKPENAIDTSFALRLPALHIKAGQLVVISGIVGGGKSSTLNAILKEMYTQRVEGEEQGRGISASGTIALASQQAWIRNATIKMNILNGLPFDSTIYERTVDACCLVQDFVELPFGENTHIGERGVNLSGGQKARIALARAVYSDADIILLDDVLAALDSIVAKKVFNKCILGLLGGKTRVFVTHSEDVIAHPSVDLHLVVTDGLVVVASSTFASDSSHEEKNVAASALPALESIKTIQYSLVAPLANPQKKLLGNGKVPAAFALTTASDDEAEEEAKEEELAVSSATKSLSQIGRSYSFSGRSVCEDDDDDNNEGVDDEDITITGGVGEGGVAQVGKAGDDKEKSSPFDPNDDSGEDRAEGNVDPKVYLAYMHAMGGWKVLAFLFCVQTIWQGLSVGSDVFLSTWTRQNDAEQAKNAAKNAMMYACLSIGSGSIVLVRTMTVSSSGYRAAKNMFEKMLKSLLHAPMCWLDKNPSGRLLNRFSDDQAKVDCNLPFAVGSIFATFFSVAGDLLTVMVITRYLIVLAVPICYVYRQIMFLYLRASREIQRLQSISQSPVLTAISEVIAGVTVIRAFGVQTMQRMIVQNNALLDGNGAMQFLSAATSAWFVLRIQLVGAIILLSISCLVFLGQWEGFLSPGLVGLSISYGLSISNGLESAVMILSWFENSMVCPERIKQYCDVASEGTTEQKSLFSRRSADVEVVVDEKRRKEVVVVPPKGWPERGEISFENVCFSYQPSSDLVLTNLSFKIPAGKKIGVVGRTGSGKSSLAMALFRIAELASGRILLDGVDTSDLELSTLRGAIQVIPQNPVLFRGTLRNYVDPFDEFPDEAVWQAIEAAQMSDSVARLWAGGASPDASKADSKYKHLYAEVSDSGENLSVGERQMLVMSRALLRGAKVLVMDEASANIDRMTEQKLQKVLQAAFVGTTTITIAHRIDTILQSDFILVMSSGTVAEFAPPATLLQRPDSLFRALAIDAGIDVDQGQT